MMGVGKSRLHLGDWGPCSKPSLDEAHVVLMSALVFVLIFFVVSTFGSLNIYYTFMLLISPRKIVVFCPPPKLCFPFVRFLTFFFIVF